MLEELGYSVSAFTSGLSALEAFKAQPNGYQLVLTDYEMPGMSGAEFTRAVKAVREDVPVLLLTGYSDLATAKTLSDLGCQGVLSKPYDLGQLSEAIDSTVHRARQ